MKIEASTRLIATDIPKPPWYDRCVKQVAAYRSHILSITSPFPRTDLSVVDSTKQIAGDWGGSWSVDFSGHITIQLQKSFYKACIEADLLWELVHTIQHEYMEAKIAIVEARKKYPGDSPYIMAERDRSLGGIAHVKVIKELDGISEASYDAWLIKIARYLKAFK